MKVLENLKETLRTEKVHMTLLDPDKQPPKATASLAVHACKVGTDAIMIGGSTGVTRQKVDATIKAIKARTSVPVILFPSSKEGLSRYADAVYFMSLLNSKDVRMVVGEQRRASRTIKRWGLETISMGYLLVWPGMRAGEVGRAELIPRDDPDMAVQYALAAQFLGMDLVYLEAGSGAPVPVPPKMIRAVKKEINIPLVVGGGIRTPKAAKAAAVAGADIVVTGTILEEAGDFSVLRRIVEAVKGH
jgi:phosphoglycerol geranylgeranyltransferase